MFEIKLSIGNLEYALSYGMLKKTLFSGPKLKNIALVVRQ